MNKECLICGDKLVYFFEERTVECFLCKKEYQSNVMCINNHYVCDKCHNNGSDIIISFCLKEKSKNPIEIIRKLMACEFCHMHGAEHHIMVGSTLIAAYYNAGGNIDLVSSLREMYNRGSKVPAGTCGFW